MDSQSCKANCPQCLSAVTKLYWKKISPCPTYTAIYEITFDCRINFIDTQLFIYWQYDTARPKRSNTVPKVTIKLQISNDICI